MTFGLVAGWRRYSRLAALVLDLAGPVSTGTRLDPQRRFSGPVSSRVSAPGGAFFGSAVPGGVLTVCGWRLGWPFRGGRGLPKVAVDMSRCRLTACLAAGKVRSRS